MDSIARPAAGAMPGGPATTTTRRHRPRGPVGSVANCFPVRGFPLVMPAPAEHIFEAASSRLVQLKDHLASGRQADRMAAGSSSTMVTDGKPQVLICGTIVWSWREIDELKTKYDFLVPCPLLRLPVITRSLQSPCQELDVSSRDEFVKTCSPGGKYAHVQAIYRHNNSADKIGIFDAEVRIPAARALRCH